MSQGNLFIAPPPRCTRQPPPLTDGDRKRLGTQLGEVYRLMSNGNWHTIPGLVAALQADGISASATSVSARIRELGSIGYVYEKRQDAPGLWRYRLTGEFRDPAPKVERRSCEHCHGTGVAP